MTWTQSAAATVTPRRPSARIAALSTFAAFVTPTRNREDARSMLRTFARPPKASKSF